MSELEAITTPRKEHITTFETDELTAHCPFDFGGPDYYNLQIKYVADKHAVESKSLKQYLESFRDVETTAEELACTIYGDINTTIHPEKLYIRLEQQRRGGIEETVEVGDYELS